jgi:adenine-specific DNA-methyltransferase
MIEQKHLCYTVTIGHRRQDKGTLHMRSMIQQDAFPIHSDIASALHAMETLRLQVSRTVDERQKKALSQYFTPMPVARFMASLAQPLTQANLAILDPAAGIGSLLAAAVAAICAQPVRPSSLHLTAYEIDPALLPYLHKCLELCQQMAMVAGIQCDYTLEHADFLDAAARQLDTGLFASTEMHRYDLAILNPPYAKIHTQSRTRALLHRMGLETTNIYTGFLYATTRLLHSEGMLVSLTPRSFCNGTYFRPFRQAFLREMTLRQIHLFDSRRDAFASDDVLQEQMIMACVKMPQQPATVRISTSTAQMNDLTMFDAAYFAVIAPNDAERIIHIIPDQQEHALHQQMQRLRATLADLDLDVSTGRVVDFRAKAFLARDPSPDTVPLLYPEHLVQGTIHWPQTLAKKPNALCVAPATHKLLVANDTYVLVKRFSAKEEARRISVALYQKDMLPGAALAIENHINYFHQHGRGIDPLLAQGLTLYLHSCWVDAYFRQFSGHTQVNATDLRMLRYPAREQLLRLGRHLRDGVLPPQGEIDQIVAQEIFGMADQNGDGLHGMHRLQEAEAILADLGLPRGQRNKRSALVLLALLHMTPTTAWGEATAQPIGITPIMDFIKTHYGVTYAPNTRETIRRQTMHQFVAAGIVVENPDEPERATNSPAFVYQIERSLVALLRTYGTSAWQPNLETYLVSIQTLTERYAHECALKQIPIQIVPEQTIMLSPARCHHFLSGAQAIGTDRSRHIAWSD